MSEAVSAGVVRVVVREDEYHDPVTLMEASEAARGLAGVTHVAVGMGEPLNVSIFGQRHGYDVGGNGLGPNDLVIGLRAVDEAAAEEALAVIEGWLADRGGSRQVMDVGSYVFVGGDGVQRHRWPEAGAGGVLPDGLVSRAALIDRANDQAVSRMQEARPLLVGVARASEVLAGMGPRTFLHAGPPIEWADMSGPLRGAMIAAILLEGLAEDPDDAVRRAQAGEFEFAPGHERGALGPMAGVISASMPVWVVENDARGNRAHCTLSEGVGKQFRFGAYAPDVIDRLRWMRAVLAPTLRSALERLPAPLDLRAINANAVQMGDELHNRNDAGTAQLLRALAAALMSAADVSEADREAVVRYIASEPFFYLNLSMASGKATADAASGIENSTIVTTMARNGTEFGLRVSATDDRWYTAPSSTVRGLYFPGYCRDDANRDLGDSTITETIGLGGFVMAGAPAICQVAGITVEEALRATLSMYEITWAESTNYRIPALGYRGSPLGIDCRKVVSTGILPIVNTGIAHRRPGVGIVGRGVVRPPLEPFAAALERLAETTTHTVGTDITAMKLVRRTPPSEQSTAPLSWTDQPATTAVDAYEPVNGDGEDPAIIRTSALTKVYAGADFMAVDNLDLRVRAAEIFGLLGPNGAGKTTTAGMLTTRIVPTAGTAHVGAVDIVADPALAKQMIGIVSQQNTLDRQLTAWENLYFHGRLFGISSAESRRLADELLDRFRLRKWGDKSVFAFSGGMAQRLMVARAIMHRPAVLFLDEPTTGLDPQSRLALWEILRELNHDGQTIVLLTHYMEEAERLCERVAIMDHGSILALDTPAGLRQTVGADTVVTVKTGGDCSALAEALQQDITGVTRTRVLDGGVELHLDGADRIVPRVVAAADRRGFEVIDLSVAEPTLETVFINLTGKELRE